ncbi:MAG: beta-ketoacyl-[acyl-carrier-protein] synthase family protein, partial [Bacteroidota bacterium]
MSTKRVVITGMGTINSVGKNVESYERGLRTGTSGLFQVADYWKGLYDLPEARSVAHLAGIIRDYDPEAYFSRKQLQLLDPFAQYAMIACKEAIADSQLDINESNRDRTAVILGTSTGGDFSRDYAGYRYYHLKKRISNFAIFQAMDSAATSHISIEYGITGPSYTIQSACASAAQAIGQAYEMIRHGMVDQAIAGGTENFASLGLLKAWEALRILSKDTCRPFSKNRKGLVLGEGAGILILETLDEALRKKSPIYAEVVGFGMTSDASDIASPSTDGAARVMQKTLDSASLLPQHIDYINAHGTGTKLNDLTEIAAIKSVFGAHAEKLAISSTKSMHGHTLGAAGAVEGIASILAIKGSFVPPTLNYEEVDPDCDLHIVANQSQER